MIFTRLYSEILKKVLGVSKSSLIEVKMTVKIKYKGKGKLEHFLDGTNDYLEKRTIINVVDFNMSDNFIIMRNYLGDEFKENQDDIESLRTYDPLYN